ncbi:hypothetical protein [Natronobacterium gregoryi]|uniref:Uncharacterized protein n=2 Tax=Natronobacterium gregoryi TaxID=44930 RepID=L0AHH3_NATGS|nr:hypothetical protein [Natronobacterium gregoryi]AFZ73251.1 hypothetical protein Natgr_2068 [Natronobacterium gregoryi SP2]ELY71290.1 hypothetical protein C490_05147 [Natronobacterium gregoryi SP2]PLK21658.1 hypothetical protein CYV19_03620 [Natronobacterium gregoryi SP2]SFI57467.1 hypothetical protein SAMN05443661_10213 [Natronobacterium gregoryi]
MTNGQGPPEEELPIYLKDFLALAVVSLVFGVALAALLRPVEPYSQFVFTAFSGAVLLAFFLFVPTMAVRLFLEERTAEDESAPTDRGNADTE